MVRIDAETHTKLKELADKMGLKLVDLGRIALDGLLDYADANGGRLTLPLDFTTAFTEIQTLLDKIERLQNHPAQTIGFTDQNRPDSIEPPADQAGDEPMTCQSGSAAQAAG